MAGSEGWRMFLFEQLTTDPGKARGLWRSIVCTHQTDWIQESCQQLIDQSKLLYRIYVTYVTSDVLSHRRQLPAAA